MTDNNRYRSAEEVLDKCVRDMGEQLGRVYNALSTELSRFYIKWNLHRQLFGRSTARIGWKTERMMRRYVGESMTASLTRPRSEVRSLLRLPINPMTRKAITLTLVLAGLLAGCGKHYWEASGRGASEFQTDSGQCIKEATLKYDVTSEQLYRGCMRSRGWQRVKAINPTDQQFRGPEDDDEFAKPPHPLSERGPVGVNPACTGPTASRPPDCPPRRR